ncbi:MAG: ABC transporter permease [Desulfohalobiaceae bacterium]|nr:ABC transporter permease [Desulfohalobiaceae bacterium]
MAKLLSTISKELLLLWRDKAGLLVLFLMPVFLVIVMSLVQANILQIAGESNTRVLLVAKGDSILGQKMEKALHSSVNLQVTRKKKQGPRQREQLIRAVNQGKYQVGVIVPPDFTKSTREEIKKGLLYASPEQGGQLGLSSGVPELEVHFDPALRGAFRKAVLNALDNILLRLKARQKMELLVEFLPRKIVASLQPELSPEALQKISGTVSEIKSGLRRTGMIRLGESGISYNAYKGTPNSVQQNVPAWTLFSIFFIVVPMAGGFIKEKNDGTLRRLLSMPVSPLTLIGGRILAYTIICILQMGIIFFVGISVLPLLGTSQLQLGDAYFALLIISMVAVLAATGYGILLGTLLNTYEQASMIGPLSIVIAAAMGGIMVPVYAMPDIMQAISLLSPLGWGLSAYLEVIVREGSLYSVIPQITGLFLFAVLNLLVSWAFFFSSLRKK